jgi:hypothetical protein
MSETWTVHVEGRRYGPYTAEQMETFAMQGRIVPHSLVCPAGESVPRAASEFPELEGFFRSAAGSAASMGNKSRLTSFTRTQSSGPAQFIIRADLKSGSLAGLVAEIDKLGLVCEVLPGTWFVSSAHSLNAIRNALVQKLGKLDVLFIVDATHNKVAWFNFGPQTEARIRQIQNVRPEPQSPQST